MTVSFKLENGFNADDGSFGDDRLFNRESSLTLSGDFGKLSFGRMGAIGSAAGDFDAAFAIGDAFDGGDGDVFGFATSDRYDNMVTYQTPSFSGFQATVQYSLNENSVDNTKRENSSQVDRYLGLALTAELGASRACSPMKPRTTPPSVTRLRPTPKTVRSSTSAATTTSKSPRSS